VGLPGVVAVVSFAGGRGSDAPDHVCEPERLLDAFRAMGRTTIPSLWIYAENDHYFGPALVRQMLDQYRAEGGPAQLGPAPPFGDDGHALYSAPALWWPMVAPFLARHGLPVDVVWPRAPVTLGPPPTLAAPGRAAFATYLGSESIEKAFAVGGQGWGWSTGHRT